MYHSWNSSIKMLHPQLLIISKETGFISLQHNENTVETRDVLEFQGAVHLFIWIWTLWFVAETSEYWSLWIHSSGHTNSLAFAATFSFKFLHSSSTKSTTNHDSFSFLPNSAIRLEHLSSCFVILDLTIFFISDNDWKQCSPVSTMLRWKCWQCNSMLLCQYG